MSRAAALVATSAALLVCAACAGTGPTAAGPATPGATPTDASRSPAPATGPPTTEPPAIQAGVAAPAGRYDQPVDVLAYDLEVAVSDTAAWMAGRARLDVRLTGALEEPLDLDFTGLAVDRVTVDGSPVDARQRDGHLRVPLPAGPDGSAARVGGRVSVEVRYRGVPDDGLVMGRNVHDAPGAFVDNWPDRARFWFPGIDHPADKATVAITVHAPRAWQVVANGVLAGPPGDTPPGTFGPAATDGRRTWRWRQDVPISTYNMVFGGAVMAVDTVGLAACGSAPASPRPDGCIAVTTWLFPPSVRSGAPSFARAARMVDHFTGLVGPFPYAKLANVQSSTRFGGMENASAIFYSERALASGRDIEGTVSHEIAHQWFGDAVTEAEWHHLWLSEGFATYFGNQFFEAADGVDEFRRRMARAGDEYMESDVVDRPVVDPAEDDLFDLLNANNYEKGGWVLHMLRGILGDDAFFRGIREYYRRFANSTARTGDLRDVMEEVGGQELGWFFDQWVFRPGYPVLDVTHTPPDEDGVTTVRIEQVQDPAWPTFRLPLVVEVHAGGSVTRRAVVLEERIEELRLEGTAPPRRVVVDPDGWVLKRLVDHPRGGS